MLKHSPIKLNLKPETIRRLTADDLRGAVGGAPPPKTCNGSDCYSCDPSIADPRCWP